MVKNYLVLLPDDVFRQVWRYLYEDVLHEMMRDFPYIRLKIASLCCSSCCFSYRWFERLTWKYWSIYDFRLEGMTWYSNQPVKTRFTRIPVTLVTGGSTRLLKDAEKCPVFLIQNT